MTETETGGGGVVGAIVRDYRGERTQQAFAEALVESLPGEELTKQAVSQWERGLRKPDQAFLMTVGMRYGDWRRDFAFDVLAALRPGVFSPAGEIGRQYLGAAA